MSNNRGGVSLARICCLVITLGFLNGSVVAADIPDSVKPREMDDRTPVLDIPLPEEGAEEEAFKELRIPPKRERLPDESTIEVRQFVVSRLIPKGEVSEDCVADISGEFCLLPADEPGLGQLLDTAILEYESQFTIFDLEDISLRVTNFFRSRDLILDTAFIPPQDVQDARVNIHVLQGRLGKVDLKGNQSYSQAVLLAPFEKLIGKPVTRREVTHALLTVWDYPRLSLSDKRAQLTFFPGTSTGETDLEMEVFEEARAFNLGFTLDNAGSELSGIYRGSLNVDFNNPTGAADRLSLALLGNADPNNGHYYSADYSRPIFSPDYRIKLGFSRNEFELSQDFEGFTGETEQVYIGIDKVFMQSFRQRLSGGITLTRKNATTFRDDQVEFEDKLAVLDLSIDYLTTDQILSSQGFNQTHLTAVYAHGFGDFLGSMEGSNAPDSSRENAGAEFDKLEIGLTRKQQFIAGTALWFRLDGQYSSDPLLSLEQFSLGGPNSVRAYPTAEFLRDKGYFVSLEWSSELPFLKETAVPGWLSGGRPTTWGRAFTVSLFFDYAEGWLNDPGAGLEESETLDGVGIGVNFQTSRVNLSMSLATPLDEEKEPSNGDDPQFFANLQVQFF